MQKTIKQKVGFFMVKSMTGYGKAEVAFDSMRISVELKSVNHRFFEFSPRVPKNMAFLEDRLKNKLQSGIARGKVDMFVNVDTYGADSVQIELNEAYAQSYIQALRILSKKFRLKNDITASAVARNPEIFSTKKATIDEDLLWKNVEQVTGQALDSFLQMRAVEGQRLAEDVTGRAKQILAWVKVIEERSPKQVEEYRRRLEQKVKELLDDKQVDEQRLLTETAIFADKIAVNEETVRLRSHIEQLLQLLDTDAPAGRKLDFIVQEMNRETNTIGSKTQDMEILRLVVDMKSEIEKIREQIQNIE